MVEKYKIQQINYKDTFPVRQRVMDPEKSLSEMKRPGDEDAKHFGIIMDDQLVGVTSLYQQNQDEEYQEGYWRIRGMAIDTSLQRLGLGRKLIEYALNQLKPLVQLWCNSRENAVGFYENIGMSIIKKYKTSDPDYPFRYRLQQNFLN